MGPVGICAIFKNEAPDLLEWIAYHLSIGFDHIVLYDNGSTDGGAACVTASHFKPFVRVIDWPERPGQLTAYRNFCDRFARHFDWVAFIDIDEFVHPLEHDSIKQVLPRYADASGVLLHWMNFGPSGHVARPTGLIIDNYTARLPTDHERCRWVKSLLRTADILGMTDGPHLFDTWRPQVNARGEIVCARPQLQPCHDGIVLNHYFTKSRQDWDAKRNRGYMFALKPGNDYGEIEFNQFDAAATEYDDRIRRFASLVERALESGLPDTPLAVNLDTALPWRPERNLALQGRASQSSVCVWSQRPTAAADAAVAIDGRVWEDKFFHTDNDPAPWWCVDLGATCAVTRIRIFNRDGPHVIQKRAAPLVIEASLDGDRWLPLFQTSPDQVFGGRNGNPLLWAAPAPVQARLIKITLPRQEFLHLAEVEVYGTRDPDA